MLNVRAEILTRFEGGCLACCNTALVRAREQCHDFSGLGGLKSGDIDPDDITMKT